MNEYDYKADFHRLYSCEFNCVCQMYDAITIDDVRHYNYEIMGQLC